MHVFYGTGASKTLKNKRGDTALDIARGRNEVVVVALLTSGIVLCVVQFLYPTVSIHVLFLCIFPLVCNSDVQYY